MDGLANVGEVQHVRRYTVVGQVQGVGFRYFVMREATKLGLRGTVRNTPDGAVDVVAAGTNEQLAQLEEQLRTGPEAAEVQSVEVVESESESDSGTFGNRFMIVP